MDMTETIQAFVKKLENWNRKISNGNFTMLTHLRSVSDTVHTEMKTLILEHIQTLQSEFHHYFRDSNSTSIVRMVRNPFIADVTSISDDDDDSQSELLALQTDGGAKMKFKTASLPEFWFSIGLSYPRLQQIAKRELLPFGSTYLCEAAFSTMLEAMIPLLS